MNSQLQKSGERLYTAKEAREIDDHAINTLHVPGIKLIQRAGIASWAKAQTLWPKTRTVIVFCGPGNNGGDGWVFAQAAQLANLDVWVLAADPTTSDARQVRLDALKVLPSNQVLPLCITTFSKLQAQLQPKARQQAEPILIVDALLGIGLNRAPREPYATLIRMINQTPYRKLALDIPTGIDATTGQSLGLHIQALATVTFIVAKQGLYRDEGKVAAGQIFLETLKLPEITPSANTFPVIRDHAKTLNFVRRPAHGHKGHFGSLVCVGGDEGMGGAIIIAAESAVRFGAGKVYVASSTAHNSIAITRCPSIMSRSLDNTDLISTVLTESLLQANALVLGPGLGQSPWSLKCLQACLQAQVNGDFTGYAVLDADALNLIATNDKAYALFMQYNSALTKPHYVMTPHPKEAQRLLARVPNTQNIQADPFKTAFALAQHFQCICLLKGHGTIISDGKRAYVCETGNAALAKAGQGDCLSGMIGALLAQGIAPLDAARQGAWAHGLAGESWSQSESNLSLLPHETATIAAKAIEAQRVKQHYDATPA